MGNVQYERGERRKRKGGGGGRMEVCGDEGQKGGGE